MFAYTVPSFLSACDEHYAMARVWVSTRFVTMPGADDADLRMTYCAFVICALLGDWSCIDLSSALSYIRRCRVRVLFSPLPFTPSSYVALKPPDIRRRIRTNATGRIARRTDILRRRGRAPRPCRPRMCAPGASAARRVARDGTLVSAHASANSGVCRRRRIRRPHEQASGCVLWVLVRCCSRRTCRPISLFLLLCCACGDPHFVD